jgi:tyrosinase
MFRLGYSMVQWGLVGVLVAGALSGCHVSVRKNVKDLSAEEKQEFVDAILALKDTPSPYDDTLSYYDQFVKWHHEVNNCLGYHYHGRPQFFPWHRIMLLQFEAAMEEVTGKHIAIPYWDWSDPESTAAVFSDDFMGGTGDPANNYAVMSGPFRRDNFTVEVFNPRDPQQLTYVARNIGSAYMPNLPTAEQIDAGFDIGTYDAAPWSVETDPTESFRNYVEGWRNVTSNVCDEQGNMIIQSQAAMHNQVHRYVGGAWQTETGFGGGTMLLTTSPADPVFFVHHAFVDHLWDQWSALYGEIYLSDPDGHDGHDMDAKCADHHGDQDPGLHEVLWPFTKEIIGRDWMPCDLLNSQKIGVRYED